MNVQSKRGWVDNITGCAFLNTESAELIQILWLPLRFPGWEPSRGGKTDYLTATLGGNDALWVFSELKDTQRAQCITLLMPVVTLATAHVNHGVRCERGAQTAIFSPVACLQVCGNNRMIHALLFFDCKAVCVGVQWLTDNDWWDWQLLFKWRSDIFNLENPKGCPQAVWMEISNLSTFTHLWWRILKHRFDH